MWFLIVVEILMQVIVCKENETRQQILFTSHPNFKNTGYNVTQHIYMVYGKTRPSVMEVSP